MLMNTSADIGNVVRDRRRELGYSQADLAAMIDMSRQWVVRFENGYEASATIEHLMNLSHALKLDIDLRAR